MKAMVSDLREYLFCPRSLYLRRVLCIKPEMMPDTIRAALFHAARKELSLRIPNVLERTGGVEGLETACFVEARRIIQELPSLCQGLFDEKDILEHMPKIEKDLCLEAKPLIELLEYIISESSFERCLKKITPWRTGYPMDSEGLQMTGKVDKILKDNAYHPVEVKTRKPWECFIESDRLEVCAYSVLLEEGLGVEIQCGFIEYTPINEMHPVMNTEKQREKVLEVRDYVLDILSGELPEICPHGSGRKCESCGFFEACYEI